MNADKIQSTKACELSDDQLDAVAGGGFFGFFCSPKTVEVDQADQTIVIDVESKRIIKRIPIPQTGKLNTGARAINAATARKNPNVFDSK